METGKIFPLNSNKILLDTSILIPILRGNKTLADFVDNLPAAVTVYVSVITILEVYVGAIDQKHWEAAKKLLTDFEIVNIDIFVSQKAAELIRKYPQLFGKTISRGTADALIAASAKTIGAKLVTLNSRHFEKVNKDDLPVEIVS